MMARKQHRPAATLQCLLEPQSIYCQECGQLMWVAYATRRTVTTLNGVTCLTLKIRRCHDENCTRYHQPYRPEEEGAWALPHGEFGLDVIALVGRLRYESHRCVPEIHQDLCRRGVVIAERTVTNLLARYEELVALHLTNRVRLRECLTTQGYVVLALDGLQPDVGHARLMGVT